MLSTLTRLGRRLGKRTTALISLILVATFMAAGWRVFPWPSPAAGQVVFRTESGALADAGSQSIPVFRLDDGMFPVRAGVARPMGADAVRLEYYVDGDPAHMAVLMDADLRALWLLTPPAERQALHRAGAEFLGSFGQTARRAAASSVFISEYRPALAEIVRGALLDAWNRPSTQEAVREVVLATDRGVLDQVAAAVRPVLLEKAEGAVWQAMRDFATDLLGDKRHGPPATAAMLAEVLSDPRVVEALAASAPRLLSSRAVERLAAVLVEQFADALTDDPRLWPLVQRMLSDTRITPAGGMAEATQTLLRRLPENLIRLRGPNDHNALAAHILRSLAKGRSARLILLLSPAQRMMLAPDEGEALHVLAREPS
ncbi:MAG: hypothetical protein HQL41_12395 [Alphaproteobacteria bacterium]|nr:hypothetical protein [Alphaproteobacteria bacterium]